MRVQSVVSWIAVVGTLTSWSPRAAIGQELTLAPRTPRFLYASSTAGNPVEIDVSHNAVLGRVVSLDAGRTTIGGVLVEIQRQTGLTFAYDPRFAATRPLTLNAESITVAAALGAILVGTGVDVILTRTGHVWLTESSSRPPALQEGTIVGSVTEKQTGDPIVGATVTLDPTRQTATTRSDGRYRFANLSPGNYTVRARYIGYGSVVTSAAVRTAQEVTVDFRLEKAVQQLEQIVTTGTLVPTEVKAIPNPVSVIREADVEEQRPRTVSELIRRAVPSVVAWDIANNPQYNYMSATRGASSLSATSGQMKVFIDGIEVASRLFGVFDPTSIERVEVIRGPQAATIYGSDALGGVMQIFTKRGDPALARPEVQASAAASIVQSPYAQYGGTLRQQYSGSVRGASGGSSYNFGGSFTHLGEWIPEGAQSLPSVYGAIQVQQGAFTLDLSGRYYQQLLNNTAPPNFAGTGASFYSQPFYEQYRFGQQTLGVRLTWAPTSWLRQYLAAGVDRYVLDGNRIQRRGTTAADTFLAVFDTHEPKTFIAYNASVTPNLGSEMSATVTAGFDHYALQSRVYNSFSAQNTEGAIAGPISGSRNSTNNTGYFGQAQVGYRSVVFLTAGLRAEENSSFGSELGTPVSPRIGLACAVSRGSTALKLRGSYGKAIRPPTPGSSESAPFAGGNFRIANPELGPEEQEGWDAGLDFVFGGRGSMSVTYYDQIARGLIQQVTVVLGPPSVFQNQNVGRVKNKGVEFDGTLNVGPARLRGQFAFTDSRIETLAAGFTGDLRVGDRPLAVPRYTAGASLAVFPQPSTTVTAGLTYVGNFVNYDFFARTACQGSSGPCRPSNRDYLTTYPSFTKVDVSVTRQLTRSVWTFLSVQNVANKNATEFANTIPAMGRITTIGLEARY